MKVNAYLHKLKLSTTDTLLFDTIEKQKEFFEGDRVNSLPLTNISFNGSRRLKVALTSPLINFDGYNYCEIVFNNGKVMYCFIDDFEFINDNASYINMTLDYIQTYMFDIKIAKYRIEQRTLPRTVWFNKEFKQSRLYAYSNNIATNNIQYKELFNFTQSEYDNTTGKLKYSGLYVVFSLTSNDQIKECVWKGSYNSGIVSVVFPCILRYINDKPQLKILNINVKNNTKDKGTITFSDFINKYNAQIINFSICDTISLEFMYNREVGFIVDENFETDTAIFYTNKTDILTVKNDTNKPVFLYYSNVKENEIVIKGSWQYSLLCRQPYAHIEIGRKGDEIQILNTMENTKEYIKETATTRQEDLALKCIFNPIYPNELRIYVKNSLNYNLVFSIPPRQYNMTFDKSKWEEYFIQNSVIVNDGLATKHSYDIEIAKNNLISSGITAGITAVSGAGAVASGNMSGIGSIVNSTGQMIGSITSYINSKTNIDKEKSLLELEWKNIKSQPANIYNFQNNQNAYALVQNDLIIYLAFPVETDIVYNYHSRYGYKISAYIDNIDAVVQKLSAYQKMIIDEPSGEYIIGQNFDFVRYKDVDVISDNIPSNAKLIIKDILESGITYWYNYDNIYNYKDNYKNLERGYGDIDKCYIQTVR